LHEIVAKHPDRFDAWVAAILETKDSQALGRIRNLGLSMAGAYATRDVGMASAVFRYLKDQSPAVQVVIGHPGIPLYEYVLFSVGDQNPVGVLRHERFTIALDDAAIEMATVAAEARGAAVWLGKYVDQLVSSDQPALQAQGLTIAGFRQSNPDSDRVLAKDWGGGFLGQVATAARKSYQRVDWARHWLDAAAEAEDPVDFWRFSKLAEGVCDIRVIGVFWDVATGEFFRRHGADVLERLRTAAEQRTKKRSDALFGLKAPERNIAMMIRALAAAIP
jgi:hypothetical protein